MIFAVSDTVQLALIGIVAMVVKELLDQLRARNAARRAKQMEAKVEEIHKATNSMKDELVKATSEAATAIGEAKGRADQKAEMDVRADNA